MAFAIIAICGGALLMNFQKSHQQTQEKNTLDIVESKLRMSAQLAKISGREVRVVIGEEDGVKNISLSSDLGVAERMKANLSRKTDLLLVREIELTPNNRKDQMLSFFPWGLNDPDVEINLVFSSGNKTSVLPAKYVPNVFVDDTTEIDNLFPREILEDEKQEE